MSVIHHVNFAVLIKFLKKCNRIEMAFESYTKRTCEINAIENTEEMEKSGVGANEKVIDGRILCDFGMV